MINAGCDAVAGVTRRDVPLSEIDNPTSEFYKCQAGPLIVRRELFENIGGYCENYAKWGYEDSSMFHKLPNIGSYPANGSHIIEYHNIIASSSSWKRGEDTNREIFLTEQTIPLDERIRIHKEEYAKNKTAYNKLSIS